MGTHGFSKNPYPYPPKTRTRDQGYRFLRVQVRVWAEIPRGYLWQSLSTPELILVDPTVPREGESVCCGNNVTQQLGNAQSANIPKNVQPDKKRMREEPEEVDNEPKQRKLRTLAPVNYCLLNDPFPDEEGDEMHLT